MTNRILLEKDHQISEDNVFKAKLIKGSVANKQSTNECHFLICEKGISTILWAIEKISNDIDKLLICKLIKSLI